MKKYLLALLFAFLSISSFVLIKPSIALAGNCYPYTGTTGCWVGPEVGLGSDGQLCNDNHFTNCGTNFCTGPLNDTSRLYSCSSTIASPPPNSCPAECRQGTACGTGYSGATGCKGSGVGGGCTTAQVCCKNNTPPSCGNVVNPPATTITPTPKATPGQPILISPVSNLSCPSTNPTSVNFNWSSTVNTSYYYLRIDDLSNPWLGCSTDGSITPNAGDICSGYFTGTSYVANLAANKNYRWWVSAFTSDYTLGPFSTIQNFNIPAICPATPTPTPTITPIAAQCVSTRIYSPNWTEISTADFSNLLPNSQVYFCVAGSTTGGAFDMARFTINNVVRSTTALQRPGSSDFCDLYTIPSNTYNFGVQGEVHHSTLGWL